MRAIRIDEWGGPEVMRLVTDADVPQPATGQVLIKVARAGINFADTHQTNNVYVKKFELPLIPGAEVAGTVEDANGVGGFTNGQRVVAMTGGAGGYAEFAAVDASMTFPVPDGVDDELALALLIQGLTAWHLYRTCARVREGESVVVISGAGGVGSLAVQLGHPMGAGRVIATASSQEKRDLTLELGADAAVDPDQSEEDLTAAIIEANEGKPVDAVFEMAGGTLFDATLKALAPFGRMVTYGISSREQNQIRTGKLLKNSWSVIGFWLFHSLERPDELIREPVRDLYERAARGEVKAVTGGTWPLSEARQAHEELKSRRTRGKLLLDTTA